MCYHGKESLALGQNEILTIESINKPMDDPLSYDMKHSDFPKFCHISPLGGKAELFFIGHFKIEFKFFGENLEMRNDSDRFG